MSAIAFLVRTCSEMCACVCVSHSPHSFPASQSQIHVSHQHYCQQMPHYASRAGARPRLNKVALRSNSSGRRGRRLSPSRSRISLAHRQQHVRAECVCNCAKPLPRFVHPLCLVRTKLISSKSISATPHTTIAAVAADAASHSRIWEQVGVREEGGQLAQTHTHCDNTIYRSGEKSLLGMRTHIA